MFPNGTHQGGAPPSAGGQHSAFSHPPHLGAAYYPPSGSSQTASSRSPAHTPPAYAHAPQHGSSWPPPHAPPQQQHSYGSGSMGPPPARHGSGTPQQPPHAGSSSLGQSWSPATRSEEDEEEDDESDEEGSDGESSDGGKKRKRSPGAKGKGAADAPAGKKAKPTRGAKACTNCRRLKMRCMGAEHGPPCARCKHGKHECVFEESNRGKKGGKNQRAEAMAASLKKMEATLNTVLASLRAPSLAKGAGLLTRSPSPGDEPPRPTRHFPDRVRAYDQADDRERLQRGWRTADEVDDVARSAARLPPASPGGSHVNPQALGSQREATSGTRFVEPASARPPRRAASPRLHSLPDNTLNPLGLLAEASLHNHHRARRLGSRAQQQQHDGAASVRSASKEVSASPASATSRLKEEEASTPSAAAPSGEAAALTQLANKAYTASAESLDLAGAVRPEGVTNPRPQAEDHQVSLGVASDTYFRPGPMTILPLRRIVIERELPPELLTSGTLTSQEVLDLFQIFFHYCSQHVVVLDPEWHTPTMICARSPFLFTCVCTIGARFYPRRPELYQKCLAQAKKSAYLIMSRGWKSVEIVQGFMLLTLWNQPAERFEEDCTWLFSGIAIRMATDLNLHRKSVAGLPGHLDAHDAAVLEREREIINRERTWLMCFNIDRSLAGQMGKPWTIREDWIIRNSRHWCLQRLSQPWDLGICALVELLRLTSRQLDFLYSSSTSVSGLNTDIDYSSVLRVYNEQIEEWRVTWRSRGFFRAAADADYEEEEEEPRHAPAPGAEADQARRWKEAERAHPADDEDHQRRTMHFITKQAPLRYHYAVLILNSFGLQHAVDYPRRSGLDKGYYFARCLHAAKGIIHAAATGLRPVLAYSPDPQFVIISYACVFLLKLTRPAFAAYANEDEVLALVQQGASLLEEVALNPTHTPALYASFLRALLQTRQELATTRSTATTPVRSRASSVDEGAAATGGAPLRSSPRPPTAGSGAAPAFNVAGSAAGSAASGGGGGGGNNGFTTPFSSMSVEQLSALGGLDPATLGGFQMTSASTEAQTMNLDDAFWSQLMPPGFGASALDGFGIDGAAAAPQAAQQQQHTGGVTGFTPSQTRANSPSFLHGFGAGFEAGAQ